MDAFLWLIFSWIVVALISYFIIGTFWSNGIAGAPSSVSVPSSPKKSALADWSSEWFNEVMLWLWASKRFSPSFIQLVVKALNEAARKHAKLNQCEIHFTPNNSSQITDRRNVLVFERIKAQQGSANTDHLVLTTKLSAERFALKMVVSKQLTDGNVVVVSSSSALITNIFGEVETRLAHIADELFVMSCFIGKPEMCIDIQENNAQGYSNPQVPAIDSLALENLVRKCVVSAVLNFSLSEFLYSTSDSARNSMARLSSEFRNLSFLNEHYPPPPTQQQINQFEANLPPNIVQIRVLGAQNLGLKQDVNQPFVCIEIDEPSKKFVTAKAVSKHIIDCNPIWEETFEFDLTPTSDELLFEVYDEKIVGKPNSREKEAQSQTNRFLGLAIVGLNELKTRSHLPVHQLQLQKKPYGNGEEAGSVTGVLLVEARFLHIPIDSNALPCQPNNLVTNTMRQQQPKFPTMASDDHSHKKGSLSHFQPSYIYNLDNGSHSPSQSPPKSSLLTDQSHMGNQYPNTIVNNQPFQQEQEPVLLDYGQIQQQSPGHPNYHYNSMTNPHDRQGSPSTPSQHSLIIHQVNQNSLQPSPVGHSTEIISAPYIDREQQQYSLERATQKPRMIDERPNASKSMDQFSVPSIFTYSPQGVAMNEPNMNTSRRQIFNSSPPPPVPPHQSPSALEETARKAREREPKTQPAKRRENSFFEEIRQRLSRGSSKVGRKRAKSLDEQNPELEEAVSVPPSRDNSATRGPKYSAQCSEKSINDSLPSGRIRKNNNYSKDVTQLILELDNSIESGENANGKRYYLIPSEITSEPAAITLMRNGKKLHVYNNHTFVAVKLRGRVMCNVCGRSISGNFTKQAYQCRDCRKVSHKSCHQRSSSPCRHSNLSNLKIIEDVDWVDFLRQYQLGEYISVNGL